MDLYKKGILFLLGSCCLKLSNSIINLVSDLIWNSFLNWNRNLFWFKTPSPKTIWKQTLAYRLPYKHSAIVGNLEGGV